MSKQYSFATGGVFGFLCVLTTAVLFVLKVTGVMTGSWWLVFAPMLAYAGLIVVVLAFLFFLWIVMLLVALVIWWVDTGKEKKRAQRQAEMNARRRFR